MTTKNDPVSAAPAVAATPEEVKSFRAQQEEEWGTYVAVQPISFNGALAYLPGDPVPTSNANRHGYVDQGLVAKVNSAQAKKLIASIHEAASPEPIDVGQQVSLGVPVPE